MTNAYYVWNVNTFIVILQISVTAEIGHDVQECKHEREYITQFEDFDERIEATRRYFYRKRRKEAEKRREDELVRDEKDDITKSSCSKEGNTIPKDAGTHISSSMKPEISIHTSTTSVDKGTNTYKEVEEEIGTCKQKEANEECSNYKMLLSPTTGLMSIVHETDGKTVMEEEHYNVNQSSHLLEKTYDAPHTPISITYQEEQENETNMTKIKVCDYDGREVGHTFGKY